MWFERLTTVGRSVLRAVEREATLGDAVCEASHDGSREAGLALVEVAADRLASDGYVGHPAVTVGGEYRHHAGSEIGDLHGEARTVGEGVKRYGFSVDGRFESFGVGQDGRCGVFRSAGGQ